MTEEKQQNESTQNNEEFKPFTNDFIFALVMRDPDICKGIAELIIPDEEIGEVKIAASENSLPDEKNEKDMFPCPFSLADTSGSRNTDKYPSAEFL